LCVGNYCYVASARRRARRWDAHGWGGERRGHIVSPSAQLVIIKLCETTISRRSYWQRISDALLVWCGGWLWRWNYDQHVAGSLTAALAGSDPVYIVHIHVPLSPSSIIWYWPEGGDAQRLEEYTARLAKSTTAYRRVYGFGRISIRTGIRLGPIRFYRVRNRLYLVGLYVLVDGRM